MNTEKTFLDAFRSQTNSYIKFLIYQTIIIFIIVSALSSAVNTVENKKVEELVGQVKELQKISGKIPISEDYLINAMYFDEKSRDTAHSFATNDTVKIIYTSQQNDSAYNKQLQLIQEIETISDKSFTFSFNFLGNISIDLRFWIFFLPFVFFLSCIYIFILDYKIYRLKMNAIESNMPVKADAQFPYKFLRLIFLIIEVCLICVYVYDFLIFFRYADGDIKEDWVIACVFFIYYGIAYILYFVKSLNLPSNTDDTTLAVYGVLRKFWLACKNILKKFSSKVYFTTSNILIFLSLCLVMTYDSCNNYGPSVGDVKDAVRGYQLIVTLKRWQGDDIFTQFFYKYMYAICVIVTVLFSILFFLKKEKTRKLAIKSTTLIVLLAILIFTYYFDSYDLILSLGGLYVLVAFVSIWGFYFLRFRSKKGKAFFGISQLKNFVIFILPFTCFSYVVILKHYYKISGWIYFYTALWAFIFGIALIWENRFINNAPDNSNSS